MKTLTWLHISDLHLCPNYSNWDATAMLDKIKQDLTKLKMEYQLSPNMIFVTGDIMYGAKPDCGETKDQYGTAGPFLLELLATCNVSLENLFIVPGNHDVNTTVIRQSQSIWLEEQNVDSINDMLNQENTEWLDIIKRLADYRIFLEKELQMKHLLAKPNHLIYAQKRQFNGINVGIAGLNTAWSSCGQGIIEKGKLWVGGQWQIQTLKNMPELKGSDVTIALTHHPCNWLRPSEDPRIVNKIQSGFNFHLHGHEHQGWVEVLETPHHCRIAAGAIYIRNHKEEQSSYNLVRLDYENRKCEIWFRRYDEAGDGGWVTKEIPGKTDALGIKIIDLSRLLPDSCAAESHSQQKATDTYSSALKSAGPESRGLYGREQEISQLTHALRNNGVVFVAGLAGIGKTWVINETLEYSIESSWKKQRFRVEKGWGLKDLFSLISPALGITDEFPEPPIVLFGKRDWTVFSKKAKKGPFVIFHIGRIDWLLNNGRFMNCEIQEFFTILSKLPNVRIILETREEPIAVDSSNLKVIKFSGLGLDSVKAFFAKPYPISLPSAGWELSEEQAVTIFQRLGGSSSRKGRAHPMGMRLLTTIAVETGRHPSQILNEKTEKLYEKLEKELFLELYEHTLNPSRRKMIEITALYRGEIPDTHVDLLNSMADEQSTFDDLRRLFLINTAPGEDYYYVHDLIRDLIQWRMISNGQDPTSLHEQIAMLWLKQAKGALRASNPNRRAATEALYHILQSGSYRLLCDLPAKMIRGGELIERAEALSDQLRKQKNDVARKNILDFLVAYNPHDHKSHRFLGETIERLNGEGHADAFDHYWKAYDLDKTFPPYLANLGRYWSRTNEPERFVTHLTSLPDGIKSKVIDEQVLSIYTTCLEQSGNFEAASKLRSEQIVAGHKNPVFYNAEVQYLLGRYKAENKPELLEKALAILKKAADDGIADEYTKGLHARALELKS